MLIDSGKTKNQYTEKQKIIIIENLNRKYKFVEVFDYGASVILMNFQRNLRAQIFFDGIEISYEVYSISEFSF